MKNHLTVIGIDQSYQNTGITFSRDGEVLEVHGVSYPGCRNNTEKRKYLRERLLSIAEMVITDYPDSEYMCVVERIRLQSDGFLNMDYIKGIGALNACIVDVMYEYGIPVYSVDTRAWKTAIVGTARKQPNKYGLPEKKFPTIQWCVKHGYKKWIKDYNVGKRKKGILVDKRGERYTYDNDKADSICISLYPFSPSPKLQEEH